MPNIVRTKLWDWQYLFAGDSIEVAADKIVKAAEVHQERVRRDYLDSADRLVASQETGRELLSGQLSDIADELAHLGGIFRNGMDQLAKGLGDLDSSFNWGIRQVVWNLAEINKKLASPLDVKAANFRKHGIYAYDNGWPEEAVKDLLEAEELNRYDFVVHQYLGDAFLWKLSDPQKAFEYYQKAARYAMPHSREVAGWAKLHAALVKYFQKEFGEAARLAKEAVELCPSAEAHYQYAHYLMLAGDGDLAEIVRHLEIAIKKDPPYFLKIDFDQKTFEEDFRKIKDQLQELKKRMFQEAETKAVARLDACRSRLSQLHGQDTLVWTPRKKVAYETAAQAYGRAVELADRRSYLDDRLVMRLCRQRGEK